MMTRTGQDKSNKTGLLVGGIVTLALLCAGGYTLLIRSEFDPVRDIVLESAQSGEPAPATGSDQALQADISALSACFAVLDNPNFSPERRDRALRQEQLAVAHYLHGAFKEDVDALFVLAMAYQEQGQSIKAVEYLIGCLKQQGDRADAYDQLGRIAQQKGDHAKATSLFQEAVTCDPNLPGIHTRLAEALKARGDLVQAQVEIEKEIQSNALPDCYLLLGQICLQRQAYEEARQAYERAVQLNPDLAKAYFGLATACARLGQREQALAYQRCFKEAEAKARKVAQDLRVTHDPLTVTAKSVAHTHTDVARIYRAQGKPGQAGLLWQRAITLDPTNVTCCLELADLLLRSERLAEALTLYQRVVRHQPNNGVAWFFIGHIQGKQGQLDAAEGAYQKVIEVGPDRPEGYRALARFYLQTHSHARRARELAERAVALDASAPNYFLLAQTCTRLEERPAAVTAMGRALDLAPGHSEYLQFLQTIQVSK
jgi:tetratricopeptide (TPR) repeat protein